MNSHFSDRQLLDAQFKLRSGAQAQEIAAHLSECAECRRRSEALKHKFSSLDLLRGGVSASEQLITDTLRQIRNEPAAEHHLFRRFVWLTGATAAAAILVALIYTSPFAIRFTQLASSEKAPEPVMQIAMQKDEEKHTEFAELGAPAETPIPAEEVAKNEIALEGGGAGYVAYSVVESDMLAAASKPQSLYYNGVRVAEDAKDTRQSLRYAYSISLHAGEVAVPASRAQAEWTSSAPDNVSVQVYPALIECDKALIALGKDTDKQVRHWSVRVVNSSSRRATASISRSFGSTNWNVSVPDNAVHVTTQDAERVQFSVEVKPQTTKTFTFRTILPAEPAKGDGP